MLSRIICLYLMVKAVTRVFSLAKNKTHSNGGAVNGEHNAYVARGAG